MKNLVRSLAVTLAVAMSFSSLTVFAADSADTSTQENKVVVRKECRKDNAKEFKFEFRKNDKKTAKKEMTEEEKATMLEKIKSKLETELKDGKITQEEYDKKVSEINSGNFKQMPKVKKGTNKKVKYEKNKNQNATNKE